MLTRRKAETRDVESGQQAIAELVAAMDSGTPYDLILADLHMPGMDGIGLVEQVRMTPGLRTTAIMMLTSATHQETVQRCRELGVACYLLKPVRQWELLAAIGTAIGKDGAAPSPAATMKPPAKAHGGLTILLAEDNAINQRVAVRTLERMGHSVVVANNGMEALALLARNPIDLILMDIQMPEMDGFTATRQIRKGELEGQNHIPIVAMTAHNMKGDRERCLDAGMDGYVSKPINGSDLQDAIVSVTRGKTGVGRAAVTGTWSGELPDDHDLDWDPAQTLDRVGGDEELLFEVVEIFLNEAPSALVKLRRALSDKDPEAVERIAHGLKGEIGYLGIRVLSQGIRELEEAGRRRDLSSAGPLLASLEAEIPYVVRAVRQACSEMQDRQTAQERGIGQ